MSGHKQRQTWTLDQGSLPMTVDQSGIQTRSFWNKITFIPKLGDMCLHQNLEEELQGLKSPQDRVIKESIACRSEPADSDAKNWNRLSSGSVGR